MHFTLYTYGASQAVARDFDGDGDLDIAAIAFFPDYGHQPEEGFVLFDNEGTAQFKPYTFPNSQLGRWLTMEAADFDGDGDEDIILGAFAFSAITTREDLQRKWIESGVDVVVLQNNRIPDTK